MTLTLHGIGQIIFDGNSRTDGYGATAPGNAYPNLIGVDLPAGWSYLKRAVGGRDLSQAIIDATGVNDHAAPWEGEDCTEARPGVDPFYDADLDWNVVVIWEGLLEATHNPGITGQQIHDRLRDYCLARRAAGFKVLVCTEIPSANDNGGCYAPIKASNVILRRRWSEYADGICDLAADPRFNYTGAENDRTYWGSPVLGGGPPTSWDGWHMGDAGYAVIAELVGAALPSVLLPHTPHVAPPVVTRPSLRIGSDTLGWQEFGEKAALGAMTRAMPGGDGSLEFTIPGKEAGERRNVLRKNAEVILDTGDDQWGGLIVGDPMAGYYTAQPVVSVAASGIWSQAANRRDVAYVWCDSDPTQWFRVRQYFDNDGVELVDYIDQGKFTIDTEGRLMIRGDADRVFHEGSYATLAYWLGQGIADSGNRIVGVDISYTSHMPADWMAEVDSYFESPWGGPGEFGNVEWADGTSRSAWRSQAIDLAGPARSLLFSLDDFALTGSPATDPFFKARTVVVRCRMDGDSVDRAVTLDKAMCDLATLPGLATVTRSETLGAARDQLAIRPEFEKSVADGLRELAALHGVAVEHFFDRTAGAWRFTCNEMPETVDPTRNRHWVFDDSRPGEDTSGVVRDPEVAPEYLRVTYLSSGVASVPDGQPRSYCYPSEPTDFVANVVVNTDQADVKLTDLHAAYMAALLHTQMSVAAFSGSAVLPQTALTVAGQELPSRLIRPGDRVNIMGRESASNLYVSETSYDWPSGRMSVTVGWPFDVLTAPRKPTSWAPWPVAPS